MKKILYCITKGNFGGAQKYVYDLAINMDKNQYDVTVLCGEGDTLPKKLQEKNIKVIRMDNMRRDIGITNEIKSFIEIYKIFKKEKPDIIHLNSSKMGGIGSFIGRIIGIKKIILTAHGFAFNEDRSFISRKIILFFHWLTILLTHKTIVVSDKTKSGIEHLPFMKNKLIKIYNGIDTNIEFYSKAESQEILLKDKNINIENKIILLSIGELHKNKGYDLFIKYLTEFDRDFIYIIIGDGEEKNNIETIIKDNDLTDKVYLLGRIEDAYKHIRSADIFLLPSRTEAFPYVLLESGLGNSAILASRVGGIPEIIIENETGLLFNIYDKNNCLDQLKRIIDDKNLRDKISSNIHNKIVNEFSQDKMIRETVSIYNK
jgi:glycosyltransferase involved in cell wall biosynthesis